MADRAFKHGILKLVFKAAGRPDAAFGRKRSAEHRAAVRQPSISEAASKQFGDVQEMAVRVRSAEQSLRFVPPGLTT